MVVSALIDASSAVNAGDMDDKAVWCRLEGILLDLSHRQVVDDDKFQECLALLPPSAGKRNSSAMGSPPSCDEKIWFRFLSHAPVESIAVVLQKAKFFIDLNKRYAGMPLLHAICLREREQDALEVFHCILKRAQQRWDLDKPFVWESENYSFTKEVVENGLLSTLWPSMNQKNIRRLMNSKCKCINSGSVKVWNFDWEQWKGQHFQKDGEWPPLRGSAIRWVDDNLSTAALYRMTRSPGGLSSYPSEMVMRCITEGKANLLCHLLRPISGASMGFVSEFYCASTPVFLEFIELSDESFGHELAVQISYSMLLCWKNRLGGEELRRDRVRYLIQRLGRHPEALHAVEDWKCVISGSASLGVLCHVYEELCAAGMDALKERVQQLTGPKPVTVSNRIQLIDMNFLHRNCMILLKELPLTFPPHPVFTSRCTRDLLMLCGASEEDVIEDNYNNDLCLVKRLVQTDGSPYTRYCTTISSVKFIIPDPVAVSRLVEDGADVSVFFPGTDTRCVDYLARVGTTACVEACLTTVFPLDLTPTLHYLCYQPSPDRIKGILEAVLRRYKEYPADTLEWESCPNLSTSLLGSIPPSFAKTAAEAGCLSIVLPVLRSMDLIEKVLTYRISPPEPPTPPRAKKSNQKPLLPEPEPIYTMEPSYRIWRFDWKKVTRRKLDIYFLPESELTIRRENWHMWRLSLLALESVPDPNAVEEVVMHAQSYCGCFLCNVFLTERTVMEIFLSKVQESEEVGLSCIQACLNVPYSISWDLRANNFLFTLCYVPCKATAARVLQCIVERWMSRPDIEDALEHPRRAKSERRFSEHFLTCAAFQKRLRCFWSVVKDVSIFADYVHKIPLRAVDSAEREEMTPTEKQSFQFVPGL